LIKNQYQTYYQNIALMVFFLGKNNYLKASLEYSPNIEMNNGLTNHIKISYKYQMISGHMDTTTNIEWLIDSKSLTWETQNPSVYVNRCINILSDSIIFCF